MPSTATFFVEQLAHRLRQSDLNAQRAERDAREAARILSTESEKKEDGRAALEFGSLASGQLARAATTQAELQALARFFNGGIPAYGAHSCVGLGAIVDVAIYADEAADEERTFIFLPVGAGTELHGPGGDGYLTVITPASPVGRALMGRRVGDVVDVTIAGEIREWEVVGMC